MGLFDFNEFGNVFGNLDFMFNTSDILGNKVAYGVKDGYDPIAKALGFGMPIDDKNSPAYQLSKAYYESKYPNFKYEETKDALSDVDFSGIGGGRGRVPQLTEEDKTNLKAMGATYGLMALGDIEKQYATQQAFDPLSDINIAARTNTGSQGNFAEGGMTTKPGYVPYQTESEEVLVLPDLSIIDTAATKKHGKMKKDQVTDYIPEGTYIGSARVKLKKKDADKIVISTTAVKYKEGEKPKEPKQYTLGDLFTKPTMSVADVIRQVAKKLPVIDKPGDIMVGETNDLNKAQRIPYLQAIVGLAESQKSGKDTENDKVVPIGKRGGIVTKENVPKAFPGAIVAGVAAANALGSIWNYYQAKKTSKEVERDINSAYGKSNDLIGAGAAIGLGAILGQDPVVSPTDYSAVLAEANNMPGEVPFTVARGINETGETDIRAITKDIFDNSSNFGEAINGINKLKAGDVSAKNKAALNIAQLNSQISANKAKTVAAIKEKIAKTNSDAANMTRNNRNKQLASIGNLGVSTTNSLSDLLMSKTNALMALKLKTDANQQKAVGSLVNNLSNAALMWGMSIDKEQDE